MNSGLNSADPTLVAAFRSALLHQLGIVLAIFILLVLIYGTARGWWTETQQERTERPSEPKARRLLRVGFGLIWLLDGILQAQPKMTEGLPSQVIAPAAASSPRWVQHVVNAGGTIWSYHPIQAGAAAVWIQLGLGLWLIVAADGWWSRLAGVASVVWGLLVWVFGEAFGGIFGPGLTWLFGAPGAVGIYVAAGALIALPVRAWIGPRLGRFTLAAIGLFWIGMAVLQAWPGRGFWGGGNGTLTGMVQSMAQTSQPHALASLVSAFANFTAADGFAVNLVAVIALALFGGAFVSGDPRLLRYAVPAAIVFCLADWVLVEDLGFLGGLGTDPNSMVPWALLLWASYRAATQPFSPERAVPSPGHPRSLTGWLHPAALRPSAIRAALASASAGSVAALGAIAVVIVGAAPMAAAATDRNADPIIAETLTGSTAPIDLPAPHFSLTSQDGRQVSLGSLRGKVILLTFLDPVCTTDCPVIAQEMKSAGALLGADASRVELVAIAANPTYYATEFTRAFDHQEGLDTVRNWLYLTGTLDQLQQVWGSFGVEVENAPAGAMSVHSDIAVVIDASGHIREEISDDPGPGTATTRSSFAVLLSDAARQTLDGQ